MNRLLLQFVPGILCAAAALRRHGDLGDTISSREFWILLLLGVGALVAYARRTSVGQATPPAGWPGMLPAALGLLWLLAVPTETALAVALLGAGWVLASKVASGGRWRHLVAALEFALFGLLVLVAVTWLVDVGSLLALSSERGAQWTALVLRLFGIEAASQGAYVFLDGPREQQAFLVTPNNLGLVPHLAVTAVVIGWRMLGGVGAVCRRWPMAFCYLPTALLLRFLLFMMVGIVLDHTARHDHYDFNLAAVFDWRVGLCIDLLAGLAAAAVWLRPMPPIVTAPAEASPVAANRTPRPALLVVAALVGLLWSADRILDALGQPAAERPVRVAVDELHSHWESSDIHLTRDHYGQESGYNLRGLCDWLEGGYGPIRRLYDPMSDGLLAEVDVLVVKTPTQAFTTEELAAIDRFVQRGGGLVLIGDHTNVYGTSEILNTLAAPLGFRFVYDCCFDQRRRFEFRYAKETHVAGHPTLAGLDEILFEVGCTIAIESPRVRPILVGRALKSQPIDYGVENYYGKPRDRSEQHCGQFPILVTANRGKGRVVAVADSTLFSTFSVFMPGRREIVEGMISFASGNDVGEPVRNLLWRIALGLTLLLFVVLLPGAGLRCLLTCSLLAWGVSHLAMAGAERLGYPGHPDLPAANAPAVVKFVREDETVDWPTHGFVSEPSRAFSLFFQFVSRVGAYPRLVRDPAEAMASPGPLVWIDPATTDSTMAEDLVAFARQGGTVVLMEQQPRPLVDAVARLVGLQMTDAVGERDGGILVSRFGHASDLGAVHPARGIAGGEPLLRIAGTGGRAVAAVTAVGTGRIVLVTCGAMFADSEYGFRYGSIPDDRLRRLYEVQYAIMQAAVSKRG